MAHAKFSFAELEYPSEATTTDGAVFFPPSYRWIFGSLTKTDRVINFEKLSAHAEADFVEAARYVFYRIAIGSTSSHVCATFEMLFRFVKFVSQERKLIRIGVTDIISYKGNLKKRNEYYLGRVRIALNLWHDLGLPGVDDETIDLLKSMRLQGNMKGEAVRAFNPDKGPFTDIEYQGIIAGINTAYADGCISGEDYLIVLIFMAYGMRAVQLVALKVCDLHVRKAENGDVKYWLNVPRAKMAGGALREEFKMRAARREIGELLEEHIDRQVSLYGDHFADVNEVPLFVNADNENMPYGFRWHYTSEQISFRLEQLFNTLDVKSERTGARIKVTTRRFRYTMGTRAAIENASELVIAEILDHSDTQNVGVYVATVPEIVERIDRAMAQQLAPLAQAFQGLLIDGEHQATRGRDPTSRIVHPDDFVHPVGSCGRFGFCGAYAPLACYTCRNFQPWLDGPHEMVLTTLLAERERVKEQTGDLRIASVNDRTIYACAQVVKMCQERKGKEEGL